jgi:hypothetical protein
LTFETQWENYLFDLFVFLYLIFWRQGTKWLMDASSKQLTPASLWLDVIFAIEVKAHQLNVEHITSAFTLIRKHLHLQRKEKQNIFQNWKYYLEHFLTFLDTLLTPQLTDISQPTPDQLEGLQGLLKVRMQFFYHSV